ncbi:hypothetical protein [Mycobacterium malmoense]|nr:hypothetical protein [Mycobacterium malmoense]
MRFGFSISILELAVTRMFADIGPPALAVIEVNMQGGMTAPAMLVK